MKKSVDHRAAIATCRQRSARLYRLHLSVKSLVQAVIENAIGSASRDYRFEKVTANELDDLLIDINV